MTTWTKLDINQKPISQIRFCKKILTVENFNYQLLDIIYRLNVWGMVFSLNQMLNVSLNLQIAIYLKDKLSLSYIFFNDVEEHEFPSNWTKSYLKLGERFFSTVTWVLQACIQFEIRKILACLFCETVKPRVWQCLQSCVLRRNKFDKVSFSGILRGCWSHLNEAQKE